MVLSLGGKTATVPALPSVSGAKITGAIMLATLARQHWAAAAITESAPDALLVMDSVAGEFINTLRVNSDAEKLAALAAFTALAYHEQRQGWHDLRRFDKAIFEPVPAAEAVFWFPARKN